MYVRGGVERAGRHTSVLGPARKNCVACQTEDVPVLPARTMFVATTSMLTRAGRASRKWTYAASRKPSPFGLTVVSSGRSPANGAEPFVTWRFWSVGANARAARTAAVTAAPSRLQFPYLPMMQGTIAESILILDEATPHLCRPRGAGSAGDGDRPRARIDRRHALRQGRPRHGHDSGSRRGDRELHQGLGHDQRPDRRGRNGTHRHGGR